VAGCAASLAALVWLGAGSVQAEEWSVDGRVRGTTEYDDNIRLSPTDAQDDIAFTVSPEVDLQRRGSRLDLTLNTRLDFSRFVKDSDLNTNDQRFLLDTDYRTMHGSWGLEAEINRDSTRTSEVADTGRFIDIARKELYRVAPSRSHMLSPRDVIELGGDATIVRYDTSTLTDYNSYSVSGSWAHDLTAVDQIQTNVFGSLFETQVDNETESRLVGGVVTWRHNASEQLQTTIGAGPRYLETEAPRLVGGTVQRRTESSVGYLFNGGIRYQIDPETLFDGTVGHSVEPSGAGEPLERTSAEVNLRWQFDQAFWFGMNGALQFSEESTGSATVDRTYLGLSPSINWNVTRDWLLSTRYRFRAQKRENESTAYGNAVFVSLSYQFEQWTLGH